MPHYSPLGEGAPDPKSGVDESGIETGTRPPTQLTTRSAQKYRRRSNGSGGRRRFVSSARRTCTRPLPPGSGARGSNFLSGFVAPCRHLSSDHLCYEAALGRIREPGSSNRPRSARRSFRMLERHASVCLRFGSRQCRSVRVRNRIPLFSCLSSNRLRADPCSASRFPKRTRW